MATVTAAKGAADQARGFPQCARAPGGAQRLPVYRALPAGDHRLHHRRHPVCFLHQLHQLRSVHDAQMGGTGQLFQSLCSRRAIRPFAGQRPVVRGHRGAHPDRAGPGAGHPDQRQSARLTVLPHHLLRPQRDLVGGHHHDLLVDVPQNRLRQLLPEQALVVGGRHLGAAGVVQQPARPVPTLLPGLPQRHPRPLVLPARAERHLDGDHVPKHLHHRPDVYDHVPGRAARDPPHPV